MKKGALSISLISAILLFVGIVFKNFHWPGASILLLLGAVLGIVFFVIFLVDGTKLLKSGLERTNATVVSITMAVVLAGFLFKVQHWPGSGIILIVSHIILLLSCILMFIDAFSETDKSRKSIKAMLALIYFIFMSILTFVAVLFNGFPPALEG